MTSLLAGCSSLESISGISEWNTDRLNKPLINIIDIPDRETKKVENMRGVFSFCKSLLSIPDISKWNTFIVNDINCIFEGYLSMAKLPNLSKWKFLFLPDKRNLFKECISLQFLPKMNLDWKGNLKKEGNFDIIDFSMWDEYEKIMEDIDNPPNDYDDDY